ncbi:phage tail protein [Pedobacter sandarakinus]|uniref:phage tail protein n=1 Tax=Pedobacter sandarakinus TaxID=353156 RepID=UPI002246B181|nr:phage tail protein [Pedobacter sandarakinus]MCX2574543.1 phage tail protein [Pedobacter sandarakinus]
MLAPYPPVGFHFILRIDGLELEYPGIADIGFTEVSGLDAHIATEEYKEGGENRFAHKLPTAVAYNNLVLKRGLLIGSSALKWFKESVETFTFSPKDITLLLLNEDHLPLQAWNFINAYPIKWTVEGFNAQQNGIIIENIEFAYQYFRRISI